jgi:hypothetical protein
MANKEVLFFQHIRKYQRSKTVKKLVATAALALSISPSLIQVSWAADKLQIPQKGTATYVTYYTSRSLENLEMGEKASGSVVEMVGITRNVDGQKVFDNMAVRCVAYREAVGGKVAVSGACTETDSDGDKVFTTIANGSHALIGGTGKYAEISGTAPFTVARLQAPGPGLSAMAVEHKVTQMRRKAPSKCACREVAQRRSRRICAGIQGAV